LPFLLRRRKLILNRCQVSRGSTVVVRPAFER
jgi:hypothetical protein